MSKYIGVMYKLKHLIPCWARLLIFHSFGESHLNFCSVVRVFSCKSNIDKLHTVLKKAMRAVMPGFVRYFYKDGVIPSHTKPAFKEHNILTVQSIIAKNTLMFISKIVRLTSDIPSSIRKLIPPNSPSHSPLNELVPERLNVYGTPNYRSTLFFKGPLLHNDFANACPLIDSACKTVSSSKTHAKISYYKNRYAVGKPRIIFWQW